MNITHALEFEPRERAVLEVTLANLRHLLDTPDSLYPNGMDRQEVEALTEKILSGQVGLIDLQQAHFLVEAFVMKMDRLTTRFARQVGKTTVLTDAALKRAAAVKAARQAAILLTRSIVVVSSALPPPDVVLFGPDNIKEGSRNKPLTQLGLSDVVESKEPFFKAAMMATSLVGITTDNKEVRVLKAPDASKGVLPMPQWCRKQKELQVA